MMSKGKLNIFKRCALELTWAMCWLFGHLPHFVLYNIVARKIYFMLYYVIGYRRRVVESNLELCFGDLTAEERTRIAKGFYVVLSEIIVSTIALANRGSVWSVFPTIDEDVETKDNARYLREELGGATWVGLTAHFGLWEYFSVWAPYASQTTVGVYHPMDNLFWEEFFKRLRGVKGVIPLPSHNTIRFTMRNGDKYEGAGYSLGLIADQNPPLVPESVWYDFMGQETIFFDGGEKIARRVGLPVYFVYQQRLGRGRYSFCYKKIWDGEEPLAQNEITHRYVKLLEAEIRKAPHMWLWSHRRWKTKRNVDWVPWMGVKK